MNLYWIAKSRKEYSRVLVPLRTYCEKKGAQTFGQKNVIHIATNHPDDFRGEDFRKYSLQEFGEVLLFVEKTQQIKELLKGISEENLACMFQKPE
jgi:hypothetical protein